MGDFVTNPDRTLHPLFPAAEYVELVEAVGDLKTWAQLVRSGTGSPEGALAAPVGTLYLRTDGGAGSTLYVKESGAGNTGWAAK